MYVSKLIWREEMPDVSRRSANSSSWLWYVCVSLVKLVIVIVDTSRHDK